MNEQIPNNNKEKSNILLDIISDPIAIIEETLPDNKIVKTYSKINKIAHCIDDYNENLQETKSHIDSTILTSTGIISESISKRCGFVIASTVGIEIAAVGGFTPPACIAGAIGASVVFVESLKCSKQVKIITKSIVSETIEYSKKQKNKLPKLTQEIIYECISDPIEQTLRQIYKSSFETINVIKNTISSILIDNWEKIKPKETIIYCEDIKQNKIVIELDKQTVTKIWNYCQYSQNEFEFDYGFGNEFTNKNKPSSQFVNVYSDHKNKFDDFQLGLSQYNFTEQKLTPYEQIKISKPNTSLLTRTYINSSIPDYIVSCQVSGGGRGGNGIGAAIGTGLVFAIKISFLF
uniref:Uncharacterized protein n=1 Tax=viral metagenome TaxID=1070528 RepID=A0A6C0EY93_9ZZZZ